MFIEERERMELNPDDVVAVVDGQTITYSEVMVSPELRAAQREVLKDRPNLEEEFRRDEDWRFRWKVWRILEDEAVELQQIRPTPVDILRAAWEHEAFMSGEFGRNFDEWSEGLVNESKIRRKAIRQAIDNPSASDAIYRNQVESRTSMNKQSWDIRWRVVRAKSGSPKLKSKREMKRTFLRLALDEACKLKFFCEYFGTEIQVAEKECREFYDRRESWHERPFDECLPAIRSVLRNQKLQGLEQRWLEEAVPKARIEQIHPRFENVALTPR